MTNPEDQNLNNDEEQLFNPEEEEQGAYFNEEEQEGDFNEEEQEGDFNEEEQEMFIISTNSRDDDDPTFTQIFRYIQFCSAMFIGFKYELINPTKFSIKIPTSILPLTINIVNQFNHDDILVECVFDVSPNNTWITKPYNTEFKNPYFGENFPGINLLKNRVQNFFSNNYKPQDTYRCQCYALVPQNSKQPPNASKLIESLVNEGFEEKLAKKALEFCNYDISKARDFIMFGIIVKKNLPIDIKYSENPLFYLTLELCEAFFDMGDCCCVCGKKLGIYGLKPACCEEKLCQYSFLNLGVGSHIVNEIKRDPLATDLIIALASAACYAPPNPPVFNPSPQSQDVPFKPQFFDQLPSMKQIVENCHNDQDLISLLGRENFDILRFFILANKAQLTTIPKDKKVDIGVVGTQFLINSVSPQLELIFRQKRDQYGVKWLWHGSLTDRWYVILHTGLKDYGQTEFTTHGPPYFGKGIYMSESFHYSYWYCTPAPNRYKKSALPKNLLIISLVENVDGPGFSGKPVTEHEYTQKDDQALITRVLFVMDPNNTTNPNLDTNTLAKPPYVPTLQEVLFSKVKSNI